MTSGGDLRARLAIEQPLRFDRFMRLALHEPGLGYYARAGARVGRDGDFLTSPSLSPAFGRTLARLLPLVAGALGQPERLRVVDAGAGEGGLMAGLLEGARGISGLPPLEAVLLEPSDGLRSRAMQRLSAAGFLARGLAASAELAGLGPGDGLVLANELFDALPCRRLRRRQGRLEEAWVVVGEQGLAEQWRETVEPAGDHLAEGRELALAVGSRELLAELAAAVGRGLLLVVDYGYPRRFLLDAEGPGSPARGFRAGRLVEDLLDRPGETDLTAHVDFTTLAEAGRGLGLEVAFFTDQCYLLLALGFLDDPLAASARRLVLPGDMGTSFRCLGLTRGIDRQAFSRLGLRDRQRLLAEPARAGGRGPTEAGPREDQAQEPTVRPPSQ